MIFISYDDFQADRNLSFTGVLYALGDIEIDRNAFITGSVTADDIEFGNNVYISYQERSITDSDFNGMCDHTPVNPISCVAADLPAIAFNDNFSQVDTAWQAVDFDRSVSNWPGHTIYNSSGENQNVVFDISSNRMAINGSVSSSGDNEYGMVKYDLSSANIDKLTVTNYAIDVDFTANKINTNNDLGIVFSYTDDRNYYAARWTKYGTSYSNSSTFPGTYRRLEIIKMNNGSVSSLAHLDNFDISDPFNLEVVVNDSGIGICANDQALVYAANEQPQLNDIGILTYDNDVGISLDQITVRCDNCEALEPIANFRFDECEYTGAIGEAVDQTGKYSATAKRSVGSTASGQIQRAADISNAAHYFETSIPLPTTFTVSTWFKKPTDTGGNRYFILGAMETGGDLMYFDRSNNWRWGVYQPGVGARNGSYSLNSLDNNWHHMTLVYQNNETKLYIDGVYQDSVNITPSGTLKFIGTSYDDLNGANPQGFRAPLDEFLVFDGAMSAQNITTLYQHQNAQKNWDGTNRDDVVCKTLLGFYQFEQGDFSSGIDDTSGKNNHGTNFGGASIYDGKYCRGFDSNGTNSTNITANAFSTVDMMQVGTAGTISFWFNSNTDWNQGGYNGGERTLFDASVGGNVSDKYFALKIRSDGRMRFNFEDSADGDFYVEESVNQNRKAATWHYITATWNFSTNKFQIYIDGILRVDDSQNTNGSITGFGPIVFGDNSSNYASPGHSSLPSPYSANGKFDEVRIYNSVLSAQDIQDDMNDNQCVRTIDHFEIVHDGSGLTCEAEPVTIKACTDAACTATDLTPTDVTFTMTSPSGGTRQKIVRVIGSTQTLVNNTVAETVTLALNGSTYSCNDGSGTSCDIAFAETGFIFGNDAGSLPTINTQLSGKYSDQEYNKQNLYIQAVKTDNNTGVCTGMFPNGGDVTVDFSYTCAPGTVCGTHLMELANNNNSFNVRPSIYTQSTLRFDTDSKAYFKIKYPAAGKFTLNAQKELDVADEQGDIQKVTYIAASNEFVVRPFAFQMTLLEDGSSNEDPNWQSADADGSVFREAGEQFTFTATAVQWLAGNDSNEDGVPDDFASVNSGNYPIAANYLGENLKITHSLKLPTETGAQNGQFGASEITLDFGSSTHKFNASFSEVGIIDIDLALDDASYLGASNIQGQVINVGRFTPSYLVQTVESHGVLKANHNITASCLSKDWAYAGQKTGANGSISYQATPTVEIPQLLIKAHNASDVETQNYYLGGFNKLTAAGIAITTPTKDVEQVRANPPVAGDKVELTAAMTTGTLTYNAGLSGLLYTFNSTDNYVYEHNQYSQLNPFAAKVPLAVTQVQDSDGVENRPDTAVGDPSDIIDLQDVLLEGVEIRFGRAMLENSYGPETSNLPQVLKIEYLKDGEYITNVDESCYSFNSSNFAATKIDLTTDPTANTVSGTFKAGEVTSIVNDAGNYIYLNATGEQGSANVLYSIDDWLKFDWSGNGVFDENPHAIATFGVYRGNDRILYYREVQNENEQN